MKKEILITLYCAGLILVTPFTTIAQENKVSNNLTDKPDIDGMVAQIRDMIDEVLEKYRYLPMVNNLFDMIINTLNSFGLILYCISLIIIAILLQSIVDIIWKITGETPQIIFSLLLLTALILDTECRSHISISNFLSQLRTKSSLKERSNVSDFSICSCNRE